MQKNLRTLVFACAGLAVSLCGFTSTVAGQEIAAPPVNDPSGVETLLRGPLHEAYAEPIQRDPNAGIVIAKKPPELIDEIPPEGKPDDPTAIWIPGYWGWDPEREDFFWISGVWRMPPPDRRWVPGYWNEVEDGFQWVSGMWTAADVDEIAYLPYPPESLDEGPNVAAPSSDYYWISGCWLYRDDQYVWRPGYWTPCRTGWVWLPSHYVWTPRGAIFVSGYWDFTFANRGCVFAPVYFHRRIYTRPGFFYSPNVTVNVSGLVLSLFVQPRYHHYYWGDYYGPRYAQIGFVPWIEFGRRGYDPLLAYNRAYFRRDGIDFDARLRGWHDYYVRHEDRRPPRTWEAQATMVARADRDPAMRHTILGVSLKDAMTSRDAPVRLNKMSQEARQSLAQASIQMRSVVKERSNVESKRVVSRVTIPERGTAAPATAATPHPKLRLPDAPLLQGPRSARLPQSHQPPLARQDNDRPRETRVTREDGRDKPRGDRPRTGLEERTPDNRVGPEPRTKTPFDDRPGLDPRTDRRDTPEGPRDTTRTEPRPGKRFEDRPELELPRTTRPEPSRPEIPRTETSRPETPRENPRTVPQPERSRPDISPRDNNVNPRTSLPRSQSGDVPAPVRAAETPDSRPLTTPRKDTIPRENMPEPRADRQRNRSGDLPSATRGAETPDARPLTTPREGMPPETRFQRPRTPGPDVRPPQPQTDNRDSRPLTVPRETPRAVPQTDRRTETTPVVPRVEPRESRPTITPRETPRSEPKTETRPPRNPDTGRRDRDKDEKDG